MKKILYILSCLTLLSCKGQSETTETSSAETYTVTKTDAEWKAQLTPQEYDVLRRAGTERAFTSPLNKNYKPGNYVCAACGTHIYNSEDKFDSGTGWPSFDRPVEGSVAYDVDYKIGYKRTEVHCATCGGHLGHVFDDGPRETTGKRHCINGVAMDFEPEQ